MSAPPRVSICTTDGPALRAASLVIFTISSFRSSCARAACARTPRESTARNDMRRNMSPFLVDRLRLSVRGMQAIAADFSRRALSRKRESIGHLQLRLFGQLHLDALQLGAALKLEANLLIGAIGL